MKLSIVLLLFITFGSWHPKNISGVWIPEKINWPNKKSPYYKTKAFRTYIFKDDSVFIFVSTQRKHNYSNNIKDSLIFEGEPGYEYYRGSYQIKDDSVFLKYLRIVSSSENPKQCFFNESIGLKDNKLLIRNIVYAKTTMYDAHSRWDMQDYIDAVKDSTSCVNCKCK